MQRPQSLGISWDEQYVNVGNINIMNSFGQTPKMIANLCGHYLIVDYLTEYEGKIMKSTKDVQTPRKRMKQLGSDQVNMICALF